MRCKINSRLVFLKGIPLDYLKIATMLVAIFFTNKGLAQVVRPSATIDSTHYLIGDWIKVKLRADHIPGVLVLWNGKADTGFGKFQVISEGKLDTQKFSYGLSERRIITLTTFDTSAHAVPSLPVYFKDQAGNIDTVYTDSIPVRIYTIPVDTTRAIKPIKPPLSAPFNWLDILIYIVIAALIIGAAIGLYFFLKSRKVKATVAPVIVPKKAPHEIALEKLQELNDEKVWQNDDVKTYYVRLTDILREYIEQVFNVPAMENTTDEIIEGLSYKNLPGGTMRELNDILVLSDLVKFAKVKPVSNDHIKVMEEAVNFVNVTHHGNNTEKEAPHV